MPLDASKPEDDMDIPAFPAYLRGIWINHLLPSYVVGQLSWCIPGGLSIGNDVGPPFIVASEARVPIFLGVMAAVRAPSTLGNIIIDVDLNNVSILGGGNITIPEGLQKSLVVTPQITAGGMGDLLTVDIVAAGTDAADLTITILIKQALVVP